MIRCSTHAALWWTCFVLLKSSRCGVADVCHAWDDVLDQTQNKSCSHQSGAAEGQRPGLDLQDGSPSRTAPTPQSVPAQNQAAIINMYRCVSYCACNCTLLRMLLFHLPMFLDRFACRLGAAGLAACACSHALQLHPSCATQPWCQLACCL